MSSGVFMLEADEVVDDNAYRPRPSWHRFSVSEQQRIVYDVSSDGHRQVGTLPVFDCIAMPHAERAEASPDQWA